MDNFTAGVVAMSSLVGGEGTTGITPVELTTDFYAPEMCVPNGQLSRVKPLVYGLGIVGIILTVVVLSRKTICTSTNCYLTALAAADLTVLLMLSAMMVVEYTTMCQPQHENFYYYFQHLATLFLNVGLFASVWITVVLAVERYIAICHPMQAMSVCTTKRAYIVIASIFFISFIIRSVAFFDVRFVEKKYEDVLLNQTVVSMVLEWRKDEIYDNTAYSLVVTGFLDGALPIACLTVLNICLVLEIRKSTRYLRYHLAADSRIHSVITHEEKKITLMLIFIVIAFFICQCPFIIMTALVAIQNYVFKQLPDLQAAHDVVTTILATKSACNFIVYCWFSERFWMTFKQIFCLRHCLPEQPVLRNGHKGCTGGRPSNGSSGHRASLFITRETTC